MEEIRSVNKIKPQIEFYLLYSDDNGEFPEENCETIGIMNARSIVKKLFKITNEKTNLFINKLIETEKILIFGKEFDPYVSDKMLTVKNAFFLYKK